MNSWTLFFISLIICSFCYRGKSCDKQIYNTEAQLFRWGFVWYWHPTIALWSYKKHNSLYVMLLIQYIRVGKLTSCFQSPSSWSCHSSWNFYCFICMCACLHACLSTTGIYDALGDQKRSLDPLKLDVKWLWVITWVFWKSSQYFNHLSL